MAEDFKAIKQQYEEGLTTLAEAIVKMGDNTRALNETPHTVLAHIFYLAYQQYNREHGEVQKDHSDDICPCGEPDCNRPFGHSEEE